MTSPFGRNLEHRSPRRLCTSQAWLRAVRKNESLVFRSQTAAGSTLLGRDHPILDAPRRTENRTIIARLYRFRARVSFRWNLTPFPSQGSRFAGLSAGCYDAGFDGANGPTERGLASPGDFARRRPRGNLPKNPLLHGSREEGWRRADSPLLAHPERLGGGQLRGLDGFVLPGKPSRR